MKSRRPLLRRFGWTAIVLIAAVTLSVCSALLWLNSNAGERAIINEIQRQLGDQLAGQLTVQGASISARGVVDLKGVELRDPDGGLVARVGELEVRADLPALARKNARMELLRLAQGELHLINGPQGLNLSRAIAARNPRPPAAPPPSNTTQPLQWEIVLDRLLVSELQFDYRPAPDAPPAYALSDATISAHGRYGPKGTALFLSALGKLTAPRTDDFSLELGAEGGGAAAPWDPVHIKNLDLRVGASRLHLSGDFKDGELHAQIDQLVAPAEVVRAFLPGAPLVGTAKLSGIARIGPSGGAASLAIPAGDGGRITLDAQAGFAPLEAQATVTLDRADLSDLIDGAPVTQLSGTIRAHFAGGDDPAPGRGELDLDFAPSIVRNAHVEAIRAHVTTAGTRAHIDSLRVVAPGARLDVSGEASAERLALDARVDLTDLHRLALTAARAAGAGAPEIAGAGRLHLRVEGPPNRLDLTVRGTLDRIEAGGLKAEGLALDGRLPDLTRPRVVRFAMRAAHGTVGELPFSDLKANVESDRRSFSADLSSAGLAGVTAKVGGVVDPGGNGGLLERLQLTTEGASWQLDRPVRLDLASGFRIGPAALVSGDQRIELEGGLSGAALDLTARARKLDLARLPPIVAPRSLGLAGRVDLDARLSGTTRRPAAEASLELDGVAVGQYRGIAGHLGAALQNERIAGAVALRRGGGRVDGRFDLPAALFSARPGSALEAHLQVSGEPLADLGRQLATPQLAQGTVGLGLDLTGTSDNPRLEASVQARGARWGEYPAADLDLVLGAGSDLHATLDVALPPQSGHAKVELHAPLALRDLLVRPTGGGGLDGARLRALPIDATVDAQRVALETFVGTVLPEGIAGAVSLHAQLEGSLAHPRGMLHLDAERVAVASWDGLGAKLDVVAADAGATLAFEVQRAGQRIARGEGALHARPEELDSLAALARAPTELAVDVGPVGAHELLGNLGPTAKGMIDGSVTLTGSLGDPILSLRARGADLGAADQKFGAVELVGSYTQRRLQAEVVSRPVQSGGARATVALEADLGLASIARGLEIGAAPLQAHLRAEGFNLKLLEGPLAAAVRQLGGRLDAQLDLTGSLRDPTLRGAAHVRDGRLALVGYGSYRDLQADLAITEQLLSVEKLTAKAGLGRVEVRARAQRATAKDPYQLDASIDLDRFPVTVNDRMLATLTGRTAKLGGQIQGNAMSFEVRLDGLDVGLPELGGKDLQSLDAHPDVFIISSAQRRSRARAAAAAAAGEDGGARGGGQLDVRVHVAIPHDIVVESQDVRIEANADLNLALAQGTTQMTGEIQTESGRVEVMGRRFEIASGRVSYAGDPPGNPRLDVKATYENVREQVKVTVGVSGTAQKPRIEMSSEPPMDEAQIATLLATGRRELKRGSGGVASTSGAASVIGAFAAERLRKTISSQLPLDVLQVEVGDEGITSTKLEAGTYVTDRIYVGYRRNFGAAANSTSSNTAIGKRENVNEVRVEYQLSPNVTVESSYGDQAKGGADVVFTKDY